MQHERIENPSKVKEARKKATSCMIPQDSIYVKYPQRQKEEECGAVRADEQQWGMRFRVRMLWNYWCWFNFVTILKALSVHFKMKTFMGCIISQQSCYLRKMRHYRAEGPFTITAIRIPMITNIISLVRLLVIPP